MLSPLTRTLLAAEGFLELGDPQQAEAELENLEGADRTCAEVWALRCKIYKAIEQWLTMKEVAKHLVASTVTSGSLKTIEFAKKHNKPCLHVHKGTPDAEIKGFIETHRPKLLNIAGSRESKEPGIYTWVMEVLMREIMRLANER